MDNNYTDFDDTDWQSEAPLPTPQKSPYDRTPHLSRHSSRGQSPSRFPGGGPAANSHRNMSPPALRRPNNRDSQFVVDETISILDPRRFTPTLHANLVAEILSLRRELESKANLVDNLENELETARADSEAATQTTAAAQKEVRDIKRLLARAEKDDSLLEVSKERDEAVEALAEMKKQMERLTKSRRQAEEDLERMRKIQEKDNEKYEEAKRGFERRAHVAEGRLKAVLDEIAAANAAAEPSERGSISGSILGSPPPTNRRHERIMSDDYSNFSPIAQTASDAGSIRSFVGSIRGRPTSLMMGDDEAERLGISLHQGKSLADELTFEESEEEMESENEHYPRTDADEYPQTDGDYPQTEAESNYPQSEAETNYQTDGEDGPELISDAESEGEVDELPELADTGVQCSPDFDYEERVVILEELLEEKTSELERTYAALDEKNKDMDALYEELDKAHTATAEAEEKFEFLRSQGAEMDKEYLEREAKFDQRVDSFKLREKEKEAEFDALTSELKVKSASLDTAEKNLEERKTALDDREAGISTREQNVATKEARIETLKEAMDREMEFIKQQEKRERDTPKPVLMERSTSPPPPPPAPVYVSVNMQTMEIPAPPKPVYVVSDVQTMEWPVPPETESVATQTEKIKPSIIRVPAIMVSPPEPTPPLPKPLMKNAAVQTRPMMQRSASMQTEEIRLDERLKKFAPHLMPSLLLNKDKPSSDTDAPSTPAAATPPPPNPPRKSSKRTARRSATVPIPVATDNDVVPKSAVASEMPPSIFDLPNKHDAHDSASGSASLRKVPTRSSKRSSVPKNLFNNIDMHSSGDDGFPDEGESGSEYKTALSAPKPKGTRKPPTSDADASGVTSTLRRQPSVRRNAMISNGVNAHRRRSPSRASNNVVEDKVGPPFPVPARHSSRRPGYLSDADRNTPSPQTVLTRNSSRAKPKRPASIRKSRSANVLPVRDEGRKSPAALSISSNGLDSPGLPPPLPTDEISHSMFERSDSRRPFGHPSHHRHQPSKDTTHTAETATTAPPGEASVGPTAVQQTSVVDAIAQTMVGEWMWKYVRRRRSFGVTESPQGDETTGGQRHKRWVWLAPYERAVMWSSRQPTSGSALLGKNGRKLLIQSVLDVKDDTPMPKGTTQPVFNRSILILTPARALKFTAPTKERHYVWLTALSFLSHSAESNDGLLSLPPPMPFEYEQVNNRNSKMIRDRVDLGGDPGFPPLEPSPTPPPIPISAPAKAGAFSATRDSVRLAKGKSKASLPSSKVSLGGSALHISSASSETRMAPPRESLETLSAEPPSIPRFPGTSRRRSNSNVRRPNTSNGRGDNYPGSLASYATTLSTGSTNRDSFYGVGGIGLTSPGSSIAHGVAGTERMPGGWEAGPMGTVRMEAFVGDSRRPKDRRDARANNFWGGNQGFGGGYGGDRDEDDEFWQKDDPFRGF
ncbi:hypothetical protein FPQ18DRAFT_111193 [Pyronema domesticum]|nr:hypothetical protein FPQ18DRAFT_111193 [Pyronema domesticum]